MLLPHTLLSAVPSVLQTVAECVLYYYLTKKNENYKSLVRRSYRRRGKSQVRGGAGVTLGDGSPHAQQPLALWSVVVPGQRVGAPSGVLTPPTTAGMASSRGQCQGEGVTSFSAWKIAGLWTRWSVVLAVKRSHSQTRFPRTTSDGTQT
jgi:hypothetical protein